MKKICFLVLIVLASCAKPEPVKFNHQGVSFTVPGDWKIEDQKQITENAYYLSVQKKGLNSSGLFTLTWVDGDLDLAENIQTYKDEMNGESTYQSSNLQFGPEKPTKFAGHEALSIDFTATILTVKHKGTVHCFHANDKTYSVLIQEAEEDESDNKEGYEMFEKTLRIQGAR